MPAVKRCPSLGLGDDQFTCMTYANDFHYCYHLAKPKAITQAHQFEYCLNENHIRCPIFLSGKRMFPHQINQQATETLLTPTPARMGRRLSLLQILAIITALLVLGFTTWMVFARTGPFAPIPPQSPPSANLSMGNIATPTATEILFTPNPTLINELTLQAIKTSLASGTRTITITPLTNQPPTRTLKATRQTTVIACVKPDGWIVYQVKFWDTFTWLSLWVRTPVEEIMRANCMTTRALEVGQEIYLPYYPRIATHTPSPSSTNGSEAPRRTLTFTRIFTSTLTRTITPSRTATRNPLFQDTRTPSKTFTRSLTPSVTNNPLPTSTHTPQPTSTHTPQPTSTDIPQPTSTHTTLPTATDPPTNTPTTPPTSTPVIPPTPSKTFVLPPTIEPTRIPTGIARN